VAPHRLGVRCRRSYSGKAVYTIYDQHTAWATEEVSKSCFPLGTGFIRVGCCFKLHQSCQRHNCGSQSSTQAHRCSQSTKLTVLYAEILVSLTATLYQNQTGAFTLAIFLSHTDHHQRMTVAWFQRGSELMVWAFLISFTNLKVALKTLCPTCLVSIPRM